jgi:ubiquitin-conjugating enzyme E2 variant
LQRHKAEDGPGSLHGFLERSTAILFPLLFVSALLLSGRGLSQAGVGWLAIPGAVLGLVFGDFVTALVHWAVDTYCDESTPVIGQNLVKPFRVHHVRPQEICEHGVVETVGNTCILAAPLLTLFIIITAAGETSATSAFAAFTAVVTVCITVATNQFHKWAHQVAPPRFVRALQRSRLILNPEHHRAHHTTPFKSSYAITNGWLNPLLNRTGFFRRLESALRAFGVKPSGVGMGSNSIE